jgi:hypothetical protein
MRLHLDTVIIYIYIRKKKSSAVWWKTKKNGLIEKGYSLVANLASIRYKSFHSFFHLHQIPLVEALSSLALPENPHHRLNRCRPGIPSEFFLNVKKK